MNRKFWVFFYWKYEEHGVFKTLPFIECKNPLITQNKYFLRLSLWCRAKALIAESLNGWEYLDVLLEDKEVPAHAFISTVYYGCVIAYSKCFGGKINIGSELSKMPSSFREIHEQVMKKRHTVIAHLDEIDDMPVSIQVVVYPKSSPDFRIRTAHFATPDTEFYNNFKALLEWWIDHIVDVVEPKLIELLRSDIHEIMNRKNE